MLRSHRLVDGLNDETVRLFADGLPCEAFQPGDMLMHEGEVAAHMFVIFTGEVEIVASGKHGNVRVALLGPGDWVGEMGILDPQPRSATARALAPSMVLKLTADDVYRLTRDRDLSQYTQLVLNVACELSRRLRVADRLIANSGATMAQEYVHLSMRPPG
ncbi:MAG: Crp/Fnr family transcriptional regulator [Myxococcales bacterium]|nr:Crp/Fnr family transcriptional regulator [Myxococcales bacterium]